MNKRPVLDQHYKVTVNSIAGFYFGDIVTPDDLLAAFGTEHNVKSRIALGALTPYELSEDAEIDKVIADLKEDAETDSNLANSNSTLVPVAPVTTLDNSHEDTLSKPPVQFTPATKEVHINTTEGKSPADKAADKTNADKSVDKP